MIIRFWLASCFVVYLSYFAWGHASEGPQPAEASGTVASPRDLPFHGTIALAVDATDTRHRIFSVHETIPVQQPGDMTLLYPQWETSSHAATASVANLAGLIIRAEGRVISWHRDPVNVYAFRVTVPIGAKQLDLDFNYLSAIGARARPVVMSPAIINVPWQSLVLYPADFFARNLPVVAAITLPPNFQAGTSLRESSSADGTVFYQATDLETLVDSPVCAGVNYRRIVLSGPGEIPITAHFVADRAEDLNLPQVEIDRLRALLVEARSLFGSEHFDHYDFLFSLSDRLPAGGGLEHLRSSEINLPANYFHDSATPLPYRDLIAHEFIHSWNGRFRQPADLWTANFNQPMRDSLLWVYEGQTEFWGRVLAARAGYRTVNETLDALALDAAAMMSRPGRRWKSLDDSNLDPLFMAGRPVLWRDWQRREDYYSEGVLLWLDVDEIIRERTSGRKSLDDFARSFFGQNSHGVVTVTYTFEQLCDALAQITAYDWPNYFRRRLATHDSAGLLDGLERAGYRLTYSESPTTTFQRGEADAGAADFSYSLGLSVTKEGVVKSVAWQSPAFTAGLTVDAKITRVNDVLFSLDVLKRAVAATKTTDLNLDFEVDGSVDHTRIDYHGPLRYPRLERIAGETESLSQLLRARAR